MPDDFRTLKANQFELVARMANGQPAGAIWSKGAIICRVTGDSVNTVWSRLQDELNRLLGEVIARRQGTSPTAEEARNAFRQMEPSLTPGYKAMLRAHLRDPHRQITTTKLAEAAGYAHFGAANLHYGLIGTMLLAQIPENLPRRRDGSVIMTCAIADPEDQRESAEEQWIWKMRSHIAEGLESARIL